MDELCFLAKEYNALFEKIAARHLGIETLADRHSDRLDFHEVGVGGLAIALAAAYAAGRDEAMEALA